MLSLDIEFSGLSGTVTVAHIHNAPAGSNGGVILDLIPPTGVTSGSWQPSGTLDANGLAALSAGELYVNIHSTAVPSGELRAQLSLVNIIGCDDALPAAPSATDACGIVTVTMVSETVVDNGCSGMFSEVITRVWEAADASGNSVSCTQVISRERATLADVVFPDNYSTDCENNENDVFQNTNPSDSYTFTTNPSLVGQFVSGEPTGCLLYTSPSPRDATLSRMPSSA